MVQNNCEENRTTSVQNSFTCQWLVVTIVKMAINAEKPFLDHTECAETQTSGHIAHMQIMKVQRDFNERNAKQENVCVTPCKQLMPIFYNCTVCSVFSVHVRCTNCAISVQISSSSSSACRIIILIESHTIWAGYRTMQAVYTGGSTQFDWNCPVQVPTTDIFPEKAVFIFILNENLHIWLWFGSLL